MTKRADAMSRARRMERNGIPTLRKRYGETVPEYARRRLDYMEEMSARLRLHEFDAEYISMALTIGNRAMNGLGYTAVYAPLHKFAHSRSGRVPEHRLVMEQRLGRYLSPDETVHHRNGVRNDNHPDNLELWTGRHGRGVRQADLVDWAVSSLQANRPARLTATDITI